MNVEWGEDFDQDFITSLRIDMHSQQGALADLANTIAATGSNIHGLSTEERDGRMYTVSVQLTTRSRIHLADIMRRIRVMPTVVKVSRQRN